MVAADAQYWLRRSTLNFYGPDYYTGDEDNGSISSWYLMIAMRLYQLAPGNTTYTIGSSMYKELRLRLDNGDELHIAAPGNTGPDTPFVRGVRWNGVALKALGIVWEVLRCGKGARSPSTWRPRRSRVGGGRASPQAQSTCITARQSAPPSKF